MLVGGFGWSVGFEKLRGGGECHIELIYIVLQKAGGIQSPHPSVPIKY